MLLLIIFGVDWCLSIFHYWFLSCSQFWLFRIRSSDAHWTFTSKLCSKTWFLWHFWSVDPNPWVQKDIFWDEWKNKCSFFHTAVNFEYYERFSVSKSEPMGSFEKLFCILKKKHVNNFITDLSVFEYVYRGYMSPSTFLWNNL